MLNSNITQSYKKGLEIRVKLRKYNLISFQDQNYNINFSGANFDVRQGLYEIIITPVVYIRILIPLHASKSVQKNEENLPNSMV